MLSTGSDSVSQGAVERFSISAEAAIGDTVTVAIIAARKPGVTNAGKPIANTSRVLKEDWIIEIASGDGGSVNKAW